MTPHLGGRALVVGAVALLWGACSDKLQTGTTGLLKIEPPSHSFPETLTGNEAVVDLVIKNAGGRAVTVTEIAFAQGASPQITIKTRPTLPKQLPPRASLVVTVAYRPTTTAESSAILQAKSDAGIAEAVLSNLPPGGRIQLDPTRIEFGLVPTGESAKRTVTVRNIGTADLNVGSIEMRSGASAAFRADLGGRSLPWVIGILETRTFEVVFAPSAAGTHEGVVEVKSDDRLNSTATVAVASRPLAPDISVDRDRLLFGAVEQGQSAALDVRVSNSGTADLTVTASLKPGSSADFKLPAPASWTINPARDQDVTITYQPGDPGSDAGTLVLTHNDSSEGPVEIALSGGAEPSIEVAPFGHNFVNVAQNQTTSQEFVVSNSGYGTLRITRIAFGTTSGEFHAEFTLSNLPSFPASLTRGASTRFTIVYNRRTPSEPTAVVYIDNNDADPSKNPFPILVSSVQGVNNLPPAAVIRCASCTGGDQVTGTLPKTVTLDGRQSSDPESATLLYFWALESKPAGSQAAIANSNGEQPTFEADVVGSYRVSLLVQDTLPQSSPRVFKDIVVLP